MDQVHQLDARTRRPASGCPAVVMMESTQDWKCDHLVACILSARNRSASFRDPLRNPLMRPCLVEIGHIVIEHALELLLVEDQQVVQAFLSHTPQKALADRIGSRSMIRGIQNLNGTGDRHPSKAGPKFAVIITNQILWRLSIQGRFSQVLRLYWLLGTSVRKIDNLPFTTILFFCHTVLNH
jgi:hypothetical protein